MIQHALNHGGATKIEVCLTSVQNCFVGTSNQEQLPFGKLTSRLKNHYLLYVELVQMVDSQLFG